MSTPACRDRTAHLRAIPLADILRALDAQPDPNDPAKWHTPRGVLSVNGAKFFNWHKSAGGGGAIDLAMHLMGLGFREAVEWLAHLPTSTCASLDHRKTERLALSVPVASSVLSHPSGRLVLPAAVAHALPAVIGYLVHQRRLPRQRLLSLVASGDLYADLHHNAVFLLRNEHHEPVGAEMRGTGPETWRGMAPGSRKDHGYFAVAPPDPQSIVLCESTIDAISCHTLYPERLCISTAGARDNPAWLPDILARGLPTYCGFDNDPTGERMAQTLIARYPDVQRLRPSHHDWNDSLRARS